MQIWCSQNHNNVSCIPAHGIENKKEMYNEDKFLRRFEKYKGREGER